MRRVFGVTVVGAERQNSQHGKDTEDGTHEGGANEGFSELHFVQHLCA